MAQRVGRISEVATTKNKKGIVPVSPATWWRWVAEGKAPAPFKLGPGTTVWDLDQVEAFVAKQAAAGQEVAA
jgi:prophage regulatory protein